MARSISKRNPENVPTANPQYIPPYGDESLSLDPAIRLYKIEDGDRAEEGKDTEILIIQDISLPATNQKLVKRKFLYIDTFDHMGPAVVRTMCNLTSRVFEHL